MEEIQIYTRRISLDELPQVENWKGIKKHVEEFQFQDLENISIKMPTLFLIRLTEEENESASRQEWNLEKQAKLWKFLDSIDLKWENTAVMLFIQTKNFDLIYRALESHVDAVALAPFDWDTVTQKLAYCVEKLKLRFTIVDNMNRLEEHEYRNRSRVMGRLLEEILTKPNDVSYMISEINHRYDMNLGKRNYLPIIILVNQFDLYTKESNFMKDISRMADRHLVSARERIIHSKDPYGGIILANYPDQAEAKQIRKEIEELRKGVLALRDIYGDFELIVGVGEMVKSLSKVKPSLIHAAYVKEFYLTEEDSDHVYYATDLMPQFISVTKFLTEQSMRELCRYVFMGDMDRIKAWYSYFYKEIEPKFQTFPPSYAEFCWRMYCLIKAMAENRNVNMFPDMKFFALAYRFHGHERMVETEKLMYEIAHLIQSEIPSDKRLAQEAMAYMKVHYSEPINLAIIADSCGVSTSYFSRKFKEQTGENYIDVLTEIRMKEAQKLLAETDLGLDEILDKLCYSDDKHFRNLFFAYTGMRPMDYRKANRKK